MSIVKTFSKLCAAFALLLAGTAGAATLPPGFTDNLVAAGLSSPTAFAIAPDGRIFVCQQGGQLRVIKNGVLLPTPFVSLTVDSAGERGLLGIALDPSFESNQYVYVYYTTTASPRFNRVSRFTANGDVAAPGSETLVMRFDNLSGATNHNGGAIHFGKDLKLYIAIGDNANGANAQTLSTRLGKILRINADGTIPTDNPFYATATGDNRAIWALGLRNPFTFQFRANGYMYINDVGENTWEEINLGYSGANYGWPVEEGIANNPAYVDPLYAYGHGGGPTTGCAIAGSTFYTPGINRYPLSYVTKYFFADYCSGWIRTYDWSSGQVANFASGASLPVDLTVGPDGYIYYLERGSGSVKRIGFTTSSGCDLTFDGAVNLDDAQWLLLVVYGLIPSAGTEDFNNDGQVNGIDYLILRAVALGTIACPV